MNLRGPCQPPPYLVLVKVDDETFKRMGLRTMFFPRQLYAKALLRLSKLGAKGAVFDMVFNDNWPDPKADEELSLAMKSLPTILGVPGEKRIENTSRNDQERVKRSFREAAVGLGHIEQLSLYLGRITSAGTVRNFPPRDTFEGSIIAPLHLAAARLLNPKLKPVSPQVLINYYGPAGSIPWVSLYSLLNDADETLRDKIAGKVALIGYFRDLSSVAGAADKFDTAFSPPAMAGAEIHATMADNLLSDSAIHSLLPRATWDRLFVLVITFGVAAILLLPFEIGGLMGGFLAVGWALASYQALLQNSSVPGFLCFVVFLPTVWLIRAIAGHALLRRKISRLMHAFKYPIPRRIAKELVNNETVLKTTEKEMVIMYVDMEGSTRWGEKTGVEGVGQALSELRRAIGEAVTEEGGIVLTWRGDGALTTFGAPLPLDNPEERALKALMGIRARLETLKEMGKFPDLTVRSGFHKGVAGVGLIGGGEHWEYTAWGDPLNVGARVEEANKTFGTEIMFSAEAAEALANSIPLLPLGSKEVHGRKQAISFYTLVNKEVADRAGPGWEKAISLLAKGEAAEAKEIFSKIVTEVPELKQLIQKLEIDANDR